MKKMLLGIMLLLSFLSAQAQIKNAKTEKVKVYGNCGMCKNVIEKAAEKKAVSKAHWDVETKVLTITFDSKKTNASSILKKIANAGYDSEIFTAPDNVYNNLHECCQYDRPRKSKK
ncbi:cation transporter [Flavobacterium enshiense]|uniref:heavy-metal-associated domain-containing protein n=1 Tax=Flavobacterium enshiense TaxID=1341165 RepID=UPI00345DB25E